MRIRTPKKNKSDILKTYLQSETDLTSKINEAIFNRFFDILEKNISDHISIELRNFGIFEVKPTKAKPKARNPRTNEEIFVPAHRKIMFKPGKNLKTELKKEWKI